MATLSNNNTLNNISVHNTKLRARILSSEFSLTFVQTARFDSASKSAAGPLLFSVATGRQLSLSQLTDAIPSGETVPSKHRAQQYVYYICIYVYYVYVYVYMYMCICICIF